MTAQEQLDQLKKELSDFSGQLKEKIDELQYHIANTSKKVKQTRYYPNGAYMDEPEQGAIFFYVYEDGRVHLEKWMGVVTDRELLNNQKLFPTEELCKKSKRHDDLTAKMYRDMRDESINGDWVSSFEERCAPIYDLEVKSFRIRICDPEWKERGPHDFYYKNNTFISDLKALGWTEEELKIVWFNI